MLPPKESTIGRSLFHAAHDLLATGYDSVCLVNGDSPTLPTELLVETVRRLEQPGDRMVVGPATDGGYYLIGLKHFHQRLFEGADWSTERVYRQTIMRASEVGVPVVALAAWYDVDHEASLAVLARELLGSPGTTGDHNGDYPAPKTVAFLERLAAADGGFRRLLPQE